ncbi:ABC transporter substrate-binding protein [Clostridium carboxidivorans P7]|uniref:Periplasmic solute binding protein n=1 Tax=Clostridium carboxidivorans P7 TaxID=536227 RepID=C6PNB2_9CLOT|nr:metal ABC transporter substrate-binding protein [Clostridium carboxidivorans]AKN33601.1 ABC transporter substrate-binding protein [Clostridium carboxidivorans P7]EET89233.1 periplasmic solute binding protein [Clostridium carboxidivorans P7]EFG86810.1 periplasmic solute binding family protein [Clostridium carboxidivorans P7]
MLKKLIFLSAIFCMLLTFSSCSNKQTSPTNNTSQSNKLKVVVSFNAIREFAEAVGKDKVEIETIIPSGTEAHDFEPKTKDLKALSDAKIFIYNGFGMEPWSDETLKAVNNKNLIVVNASTGSTPITAVDAESSKSNEKYDPHLWMSLKGAENEAKNIKDAFVKADPSNKDYFEKNYLDFYNKLEQLYKDYNSKFSTLQNKNFVTGHAAFAYLCRDFGLKQNSIEGVFAEGEPSAKKLKELVDYCKEKHIKTIFVEDMVSPKVSETLANQVGAKAQKIYTLENTEGGKDYIETMKNNLDMIYNSLK